MCIHRMLAEIYTFKLRRKQRFVFQMHALKFYGSFTLMFTCSVYYTKKHTLNAYENLHQLPAICKI